MVAETANGCLVLHSARTIAERHNREPKNSKRISALLLAYRENCCPLDKDLSWMSATLTFRLLQSCPSSVRYRRRTLTELPTLLNGLLDRDLLT